MEKKEINALETRYKATALLLINLSLMNEGTEIDRLMEYGHMAFDGGQFDVCGKALDLVCIAVLELLEEPEVPFSLN
jgi:hypothetical protein